MRTERNSKFGSASRALAGLVAVLGTACSASSPPSSTPARTTTAAPVPAPKPSASAAPHPTSELEVPSGDPILLVTEPSEVGLLETEGLALGDFMGGRDTGPLDNARLAETSRYASVAEAIAADVALVAQRDPQAGVGVQRFPHRLFDVRWLRAATARFELVAVVNRIDRAPFHPGTCGETRLVYRLAYTTKVKGKAVESRLPMTVGLEIPVPEPEGGCAEVALRWFPPRKLAGEALVNWLTRPDGPLEPAKLDARDAQLVVNVQQLRWPAAVRPDLAGHAEYLLRAFRLDAGGKRYEPAPLENTPDVARFTSDPALKHDFVAWLAVPQNLASVDHGTAVVPERFLAKRAVSVTPRGLARAANRPFRAVVSPSDVASLYFATLAAVRSPEGLVRRLDELTCPGCHESRSIAGFHLLGDDPEASPAANAVATGISPHLAGDLARRRALARLAVAGEATSDFWQPFPERSAYAGYGAHCGLGADPSFSEWKCAEGLACQAYDSPAGDPVGQCLPNEPRRAGDPCEAGPLDAKRDRVPYAERKDCAENAVCNTNAVGFPGGMCTETCSELSKGAVCGSIAVLDPFNACVARGEPFTDCLAKNVRPAGFRACSAENPCRDDYICARAKSGGAGAPPNNVSAGACIPPYFLFQLRVDGHP